MGNPQVTPITETRHAEGFIVSEAEGRRSRDQGILIAGQKVTPGTVLGTVLGTSAAAAALRTNAGNGTFGAITVEAPAIEGRYQLTMVDATHFAVRDPNGAELPEGQTGAAYAQGGLGFTLTAGGVAFAAGDAFDLNVSPTGAGFATYDPTANDGREIATAIALSDTDATNAAHKIGVLARDAEINVSELVWGANATTAEQQNAALTALAENGIIGR